MKNIFTQVRKFSYNQLLVKVIKVFLQSPGINGEEINAESLAYPKEEMCVYTIAIEDVIDIAAIAMKLFAEPSYSALLTAQFCLYEFSDS